MRYLYLVILVLLASACGSAEHQKEKEAAVKRWSIPRTVAAKAFINAPFTSPSPSPTAEPVDDSVVVVGSTSTTTAPTTALPNGVTYVATPVNWADAMMKVPAGKRLATREELFNLWDAGALKGLSFATGVLWSASAKDSSEAWGLSTVDGSLAYSSMNAMLSAVYVNKE